MKQDMTIETGLEYGDIVKVTKGPYAGLIGEYDNDDSESMIVIGHNKKEWGVWFEISPSDVEFVR